MARNEPGGVLLLLLLFSGCAPRPAQTSSGGPAPPAAAAHGPKLDLALDSPPRPPRSLDPAPLTVRVTDAAGKPVTGAAVSLRLDMPDMPMGENVVAAREAGRGVYRATGRFTMAGKWRVTATASKGAARASRFFPVEVK